MAFGPVLFVAGGVLAAILCLGERDQLGGSSPGKRTREDFKCRWRPWAGEEETGEMAEGPRAGWTWAEGGVPRSGVTPVVCPWRAVAVFADTGRAGGREREPH